MPTSHYRTLAVFAVLLAVVAAYLVTDSILNPTVVAFSFGPPPGYTRAPGEEPEACAECHVSPGDAGSGQISISVPPTYVPGQTYQITVTHTNPDPTRRRWGFELTALDTSDEKAGNLQNTTSFTKILDNAGPGNSRQYIEHNETGTFIGQQGGASWTFNWTAPPTDVGIVTFYAAGNHANNDGNTSGDYIYFTFSQSQPAAAMPDFSLNLAPSSRVVSPGGSANYDLTITPIAGFTGPVTYFVQSFPPNASGSFNPPSVNINDANPKTSVLTVTTTPSTPPGNYPLVVTVIGNDIPKNVSADLIVASPTSANLSVSKTASPNPGVVGSALSYRIVVANSGPASATNVNLTDMLPASVTFSSASTTQGSCNGSGPVNCNLGTLLNGANAVITINVTPAAAGQITNMASVTATEADPDPANNNTSLVTVIDNPPPNPIVLDQNLAVKTVISGLDQPTTLAFLSPNEFLVLERATGRVQHVFNGQLQPVALDLAVNNNSERGLLGIALHPNFPATPYVYLYWTESATGVDTSDVAQVFLLGNRVDRYTWNGSTLTFDRNLIQLRAFQEDEGATPGSIIRRGNHNGGIIRFGPDGKLYIIIGDEGRRGFLQNVTTAVGPNGKDDAWGGPDPDDAHLTGVILRLNDDGTTPSSNPFFFVNTGLTGTAAVNIKKVFAYGIRNSFGMAFDPIGGHLWIEENGDDCFDEINRVSASFNGGWIQLIGLSSRIAEYKSIETNYGNGNLQQLRWPPSMIANTPAEALSRLYNLNGSQYTEPEFSWKYAVAPSPIGFVQGNALGSQFNGDLFVGASRTTLYGGYLFRFKLSMDRLSLALTDLRLQDKVADNLDKFDVTESESLLIGKNFGITTDIQTGPDGNLYVVSLSNGAIYQIFANNSVQFSDSASSVPESVGSAAIDVIRASNISGAVTVNYTTSDTAGLSPCSATPPGAASSRCDYLKTLGTLHFAPGEASKTILIPIVDDAYPDGSETLTITLSSATGAILGSPSVKTITIIDNESSPGPNPIDTSDFFVRQHYVDFLNREPDISGFQFWKNQIQMCGANAQCIEVQRISVSGSFFLSIEFQQTGYLVERFYKVAYGDATGNSMFNGPHQLAVPIIRFDDFLKDTQQIAQGVIVLQPGWEQKLESNKQAYAAEFVQTTQFVNAFPTTMTPSQFVDKLGQNGGNVLSASERTTVINLFGGATNTNNPTARAQAMRQVAEDQDLYNAEFNRAFVLMQYFGYLRRNPNDPQDSDYTGYDFWLTKLNEFGGNFIDAQMVKAFLSSFEYRQRFGP